ncbi:hypothetical protein DU500_14055 [Haloplanus rubicundus]|uniref:DUF7847 domain-containing protein n=1 Tax=Haloplanus rubicundus TaxID=1547898 RepID=A0A345E5I4_9EURY|nr:hypothetical protein [Haloplanus rubicundus]AXG07456.1 hypothetical protein DU500_14055 [Haloplanus rubicundus]AXG10871.1 hypothetical protein DU484_14025 [Haloplanus rubicundus]
MSAVQSLRTAVDALSRNPVLFLGGLAYALVVLPQRALQLASVPLAPAALQLLTFFLTPFVVAGVVGMAREALDGDASVGAFTATGKGRYVDLLLATLVEFGIQLAFGIAFLVLALVTVVAAGGSVGPVGLAGAALGVVLALAYLVVLFLVQFYPVVVVVDDAGPVDAVTGSVDFVRSNVASTLGYSVVTVVLGGLAALPVSGFAAYRFLTSGAGSGETPGPIGGGMSPGGPGAGGTPGMGELFGGGVGLGLSTPEVVALSLVSAATTALFFAFRHTYATAFYRLNGRSVEERVLDDEWD